MESIGSVYVPNAIHVQFVVCLYIIDLLVP